MKFEKDIQNSLAVLHRGGLILYPTDTIWGIGCDATNKAAVEKIYALKRRPGEKAMVVLVADEKSVMQYVAAPDLQVFDFLLSRQKPTTVIYEHAIGLAENLVAEDGSIAIRICREDFCRHLLKRFRKPIVSTSANFSGEPPAANFADISPDIKAAVDYIVEWRQDDASVSEPSSIITWKDGRAIVVRE